MGEESEKRFEALMDKLFHSPPKSKPTSNSSSDALQISRGLKRPRVTRFARNAFDESDSLSLSSAASGRMPLCRPWDREDLFARLSSFKSMTWFAKPQVVSPLACARRGWINVDSDTISCPSCGARLLFSTPSTWSPQQVEKAAMVFSLKLENGHKSLCPWINNVCGEELAKFPMVSRAGLVEDFKKRIFALSQLIALPVVSPDSIDDIKSLSSELEQFLKELPTSESLVPVEDSTTKIPGNLPEPVSSISYYQALKLISLCGWEPHVLPYTIDFKNREKQSAKDVNAIITKRWKQKVDVYSLSSSEGSKNSGDLQFDPCSVVLDCKLCGASIGLWAFSTITRPVEHLRFVGLSEINGTKNAVHDEVRALEISPGNGIHTESGEGIETIVSTSLGITIAGGPPPAMLNYSAAISLPVIGESLIALSLVQTKSKGDPSETANAIPEGTSQATGLDLIAQDSLEVPQTLSEVSVPNEKLNCTNRAFTSAVADHHRFDEGGPSSAAIEDNIPSQNGNGESNMGKMIWSENYGADSNHGNNQHKPVTVDQSEDQKLRSTLKSMTFNPIQQHRHFCPWVVSIGETGAGWKETLSALQGHKEFSFSSVGNLSSSSLIEVDDPVSSVEKLLYAKRTKLADGS